MCNVTHTDISAGFETDHSMVTIEVALHTNPRGPGFWKLNTSFLLETEYINQIKTTIEDVKDEYQNDKSVNASLLWEMIKLKTFFFFPMQFYLQLQHLLYLQYLYYTNIYTYNIFTNYTTYTYTT